jgi:hypothetical protein
MVLKASDELRHEWNDDYYWRESLYFNFADAKNEVGAWLYMWVLPNQELKSGMLVSFYHGITERLDSTDAAMDAPGHLLKGPDGAWVYCYKQNLPELVDANFDDVEMCGLKYQRLEPLSRYHLTFADDAGNSFDLQARFMTRPWDYADGIHPTPEWVAANRYHRSWWATGSVKVGGQEYQIDTTGDSDHSWGQRHPGIFAQNNFKMWSFQTRDGKMSVSAIQQGSPGDEVMMGFVDIDGDIQSVDTVRERGLYLPSGVQHSSDVEIVDALGRKVNGHLDKMFAALGAGSPGRTWGYEGVGTYNVEGWGECTGISSYFWPPTTTPEALSGQAAG